MGNPHKAKIIEMRKAGKWPTEIAKELGISRNAVIGICYRAGLQDAKVDRSAVLKLYAPRGERSPHSKLTADIVRAIRAAYVPHSRTQGAAALGRCYGVAGTSVQDIVSGKNWAHVQ